MKEKEEYFIYVPRQFVRDNSEMELDLRKGILLAFCFIKRFSTANGEFLGRLNDIMDDLGLHYDKSKTAQLPKRINVFIKGLDYLIDSEFVTLVKGNYHNIDERFLLQINNINYSKGYVLLRYSNFDYILNIGKRLDKAGLLDTLLFVSSFYNCIDNGCEKKTFIVCSYSLDKLAEMMNINRITLYTYLNNLSVEQGYKGTAPLVKSKIWNMVIGERIIRFPSIYVENTNDAIEKIEFQKKYIKRKLSVGNMNEMNDLDELFYNPHYDDEEINNLF